MAPRSWRSAARTTSGVLLAILWATAAVPAVFVIHPLLELIALPYTLYYFSANWRLRGSTTSAVDLYLRHFERLHPELFVYVRRAHSKRENCRPPNALRFWPHESKYEYLFLPFLYEERQSWKFSHAAGLFATLEEAGVDRKTLWEFLRDQIEQRGLVTPEQKASFAKAMRKMTSHRFDGIWPVVRQSSAVIGKVLIRGEKRRKKTEKIRKSLERANTPVVEASPFSVDWLLQRKAVVVLQGDDLTFGNGLTKFSPVWKEHKPLDTPRDCWQMIRP